MTRPVMDVTEISALAICPVKRCGWRSIQLSEDMALLRFHEHHARHHRQAPPSGKCHACGTAPADLPRKGLCSGCHRVERAAKARASYKAKGRPGREAS